MTKKLVQFPGTTTIQRPPEPAAAPPCDHPPAWKLQVDEIQKGLRSYSRAETTRKLSHVLKSSTYTTQLAIHILVDEWYYGHMPTGPTPDFSETILGLAERRKARWETARKERNRTAKAQNRKGSDSIQVRI